MEMKFRAKILAVPACVGMLAFAGLWGGAAGAQNQAIIRFVKNPDPAPSFEMKDLEGKPISLEEAKGKIVLLNFWATWCGPCRAEVPDLIELQEKYKDNLEIIALATEEDDASEVQQFVKKAGINYRVGMATDALAAKFGGIPALPTSFVIEDRKSTRLNSSHMSISYAVFCLKKKK